MIGILLAGWCGVTAAGAAAQLGSRAFSLRQIDAGAYAEDVVLGDVNADGKVDAIVTNFYAGVATVLIGDGSGGFVRGSSIVTGGNPSQLGVGDFDGDGVLDVAIVVLQVATPGRLAIYRGVGVGEFSLMQSVSVGNATSMRVADIDYDGYSDFLLCLYQNDMLLLLYGDGSGGFGSSVQINGGRKPYAATIADLNSDGRSDLVVSNYVIGEGAVSVVVGTGNRTFALPFTYESGVASAAVVAADLNGDGKTDVAVSNTVSGDLALLFGTGAGTLQAPQFAPLAGVGAFGLAAADFDGDGVIDIAAANSGNGGVTMLLGQAAGGFGVAQRVLDATGAWRLLGADVNGDGYGDLLVVSNNAHASSLFVLLNVLVEPGGFDKVSPAMGSIGQLTSPSLSWRATTGADSYEYCYDPADDDLCDGNWIAAGTNRTVGLTGLTPGTRYYWQVRARNTVGTTEASEGRWWSLSTEPCGYAVSGDVTSFLASGGLGSFTIATQPGCRWSLSINAPWIVVMSDPAGSGPATVVFRALVNSGAPRVGSITVASATVVVSQTNAGTIDFHRRPDFDGDGKADLSVFRPWSAEWFVRRSVSSYSYSDFMRFPWGLLGDIPLAADFDGDGMLDVTVFRPSTGEWFIRHSSTNYSYNYTSYQWGLGGDIPLGADFDGDGRTDLAVYRPTTGEWWIRYSSLGYSYAYTTYQWGIPGDQPVPADFDGDGWADLAVYRPSTGSWYIRHSSSGYSYLDWAVYQWGLAGDVPLSADFDGDRKADLVVYRPSDAGWYIRFSTSGYSFLDWASYWWGLPSDIPTPADFDGDGRSDLVVYRPSTGEWYIRYSLSGYSFSDWRLFQWGLPGDVPIVPR